MTTLQDSLTLHLKCLITQLNDSTLIAWSSEAGQELVKEVKRKSGIDYDVIQVPDSVPANILALGSDFAVIQKNFPESERILAEELTGKRGLKIQALDMSELIKADGALTCCSVLLPWNKNKDINDLLNVATIAEGCSFVIVSSLITY